MRNTSRSHRFGLRRGYLGLLPALLILAGCAVGPDYQRPALSIPQTYKEAGPTLAATETNALQQANPAEAALRGEWWKMFQDPTLDALETRAQQASHSLQAAAARLSQARALHRNARADLYPNVDAGFGPARQRQSPAERGLADDAASSATTLWRGQATVAYEADLFGRVSRSNEAAAADAQVSEALYRSVLLALQADVAQTYFQVREYDAQASLYQQTVALRQETLRLIQHRYDAGDIGEMDLARARSELAAAQSQALAITRLRTNAEHALAVLLGTTPAAFSLPAQPLTAVSIDIPAGLPSSLLERRPDIAAAERAMAAANARVGIAQAAFFPRLELTGAFGYASSDLDNLLQWSSRTFLLGPLVGAALSLPIFDGGRRQANVDHARAAYAQDVAQYHQTVLNAFRDVEDGLANLRLLAQQAGAQDAAVQAAARAAQLSHTQYREGSISYLDVMETDRTVLAQRRTAVQLEGERAHSAVALIRALGGGWDTPLPGDDDLRAAASPKPMPAATMP